MRRGWRDRLATGAVILLLLLAVGVTGAWLYLRSAIPQRDGEVELPGLHAPVAVRSDSFSVVHVTARDEHDLLFAQGWLHASHRMWQMELLRRTAQGRLAEIFGPRALEADRLTRTLDLWGAAGRSVEALGGEERAALDAYSEGVNAWIEGHEGALPPEFLLLGFEPEPWSPRASAAVGKVMALDLSAWHRELSRYWATANLLPEEAELLRPRYPSWGPTVLEAGAAADLPYLEGGAAGASSRANPAEGGVRPDPGRRGLAGLPGRLPWEWLGGLGFAASNNWALGGDRTAGGHPLVANDMHLGLRAPPIWFVMGLRSGEETAVAGLTLPGAPGVVVGFNRGVAWAFTNAMVDDMDFAVETVNLDGSQYRTEEGWRDFTVRAETLRVRDAEPEVLRVRETIRGPVVTDVLPDLGATLSALWLARRPSTELAGVLAMNRATTPEAFTAAVGRFDSPQQNVVWGSTQGAVGYRLSGRVPLRPGWDGSLPAAGRVIGDGWPGVWATDSMPARAWTAADSAWTGWVASANNLQAPQLFGVLGVDYPVPFRARRIADRLQTARSWTRDSAFALQEDVRSLLADRLIGRATAAAHRVGEASTLAVLRDWDRRATVESRGAPLFYAWVYRLRSLVAADEFRETDEWSHFPMSAFLRLFEEPDGPAARAWVDDAATDTVETLVGLEERAMRDAVSAVQRRSWGELHSEVNSHPLGRVGWLDRLFGFDVGPYPSPGAPRTVRPNDYRRWSSLDSAAWRPPWVGDYGPTERLVVSLEPGQPVGGVLLPAGQSGVPLDRHYRDMNPRWRAGGPLIPLPLDSAAVEHRTVHRLRLLPGSPETPVR